VEKIKKKECKSVNESLGAAAYPGLRQEARTGDGDVRCVPVHFTGDDCCVEKQWYRNVITMEGKRERRKYEQGQIHHVVVPILVMLPSTCDPAQK
jgi:hypothetical protein